MQFQADLLKCKVIRPEITETTALGAAYLAGLATGFWDSVESIQRLWKSEREFVPSTESGDMKLKVAGWEKAIYATRAWSKK
jgi:glycerol kinase